MIGKHLWSKPVRWKAQEVRVCAKCRSRVTYVAQPRGGARVFKTVKGQGPATYGGMTRCEPAPVRILSEDS